MRKTIKLDIYTALWSIIFTILFYRTAYAVPACPAPYDFVQPDGSIITLHQNGDEFFHWKEDEYGNVVAYDDAAGGYYYAKIEDEHIRPGSQLAGSEADKAPYFSSGSISLFNKDASKIKSKDLQPLIDKAERVDYSDNVRLFDAEENNASSPQKPLVHQKLLMVLVEFTDVKIVNSGEFWHKHMFSTNPEDLSVANYYKEVSGGLDIFEPADTSGVTDGREGTASYDTYTDIGYTITKCPEGIVKVSLDIPHPIRTFNDNDDNYLTIRSIVRLAAGAIAPDFDLNSKMPHIAFTFAGYEGGIGVGGEGKGQVYAHASTAPEPFDEKWLARYAVQGELNYDGKPIGIGIMCHELGHSVFGFPDLYMHNAPMGGGASNGLASFSLMSLGCWGYSHESLQWASVPTHFDPWCKIKLGYVTPQTVTDWDGNVNSINLDDYKAYNVLKLASKADASQYYLIENRQMIGYDKGLLSLDRNFYGGRDFDGGILIYHVDEGIKEGNNNNIYHGFLRIQPANNNLPSACQFKKAEGVQNIFNSLTEPTSNFYALGNRSSCPASFQKCHPKNLYSGISVEVMDNSSDSMRVKANVDDDYVIGKENTAYSKAFPDVNFCNAVIEMLNENDLNSRTPDSIISSDDWLRIAAVEKLIIEEKAIRDLTGIEYFLNLQRLSCQNNNLKSLDLTHNIKLLLVYCGNNQLQSINLSGCKELRWLYCDNNRLTDIDITDCDNLAWIFCQNNSLSSLDLSSAQYLKVLYCYNNNMDNDPHNSIIGLDNIDLGEAGVQNDDNKRFQYFPQNNDFIWDYEIPDIIEAGSSIEVRAECPSSKEFSLILAVYKDGVLNKLERKDCVQDSDKSAAITLPMDFSVNDGWSLKAFAWERITNMIPLTDSFKHYF